MPSVTGAFALPLTMTIGAAGHNATTSSFAQAFAFGFVTRGANFSLVPVAPTSLVLTPVSPTPF